MSTCGKGNLEIKRRTDRFLWMEIDGCYCALVTRKLRESENEKKE